MPNDLRSLIASRAPDRQESERLNVPTGVAPKYTYPLVFPPVHLASTTESEISTFSDMKQAPN